MKTARFSDVVKRSGRPEIHLSWVTPEKDKTLQAALKAQRVMTLHQALRGTKKDYGVVGLEQSHDSQYLVFPKSLRLFADRRVVGINYSVFEGESAKPGAKPAKSSAKEKRGPEKGSKTDVHAFEVEPVSKAAARRNEPLDPFGRPPEPVPSIDDEAPGPDETTSEEAVPTSHTVSHSHPKKPSSKKPAGGRRGKTPAPPNAPDEPRKRAASEEKASEVKDDRASTKETGDVGANPIEREIRACLVDLDAGRLRKLRARLTELLNTMQED